MKKRAAAAILGILLSLSMGLEVPAAALDGGFTSGFTSEQSEEVQQPDSAEAESPADSESEVPIYNDAEEVPSDQVQTPQEKASAGESQDGFTSEDTADKDAAEEPIQGFGDVDALDNVDVQDEQEDIDDVQASAYGIVFEWKEWEQTADGRFRLHKKKPVKAAAVSSAEVQSSETQAEVGTAEEQSQNEVLDNSEAQLAEAAVDVTTEGGAADEAGSAEPASLQEDYYTIADGIVAITTRTDAGFTHTGHYLFDENGYLVTGKATLNGTESASKTSGDFYFTPADSSIAVAYKEYAGKGAALVPWKTTVGQMKKNYWLWNKDTGNFQYYGNSGTALTVEQLNENAKKQNTYTGYFKINGEYYCLDEKGTPRTGEIKLTVNGVSNKYYFQPAANGQEIPGKMFHNGWKEFSKNSKEVWKYYNDGKKDSSKIGQLLVHGNMVTDLGGLRKSTPGKTVMISKNGYIVANKMRGADDGKVYVTDKKGCIYKNKLVKPGDKPNKRYYVTADGSRATWKNGWYRCPGAANRYFYFGKHEGLTVKKTGWQKVTKPDGSFYGWYWFSSNGNPRHDSFSKGGYFASDGKFASGMMTINKKKYFFQPSTSTTLNGLMVKNQMFVYQNKTYYATANGVLLKTGWQQINGNWYYFKNYKLVTNDFEKLNGKYGYLDSTGKYTTGWVIVNDSQNLVRYINPDKKGYVTNESKWINGKKYHFDSNGYRINDLTNIYKGPYTFEVDRVNGVMTVYADYARTIPVKTIRVSVGNPWTPTPKGRYTLTPYSRWQALMGPSWGQYGTHVNGAGQGGIFVHSVACNSQNSYNLPVSAYNRLGSPASHGCIRACVGDAKWVYYNSSGATIYIFDGTYNSNESFKGPLGRKALAPARWKNGGYYDPTDPAA